MGRPLLLRALAVVALLAAASGMVCATSAPASATVKPIGLSSDGVTYTDTLSGSVFAGVLIVPGKSVTRTFWVKNRTALPGNLAVALQGVTGSDGNLIAALSLRAAAGTATGSNTPLASANPCVSLVSGIPLAAGAALQIDVRLTLASSLTNQTSQGSIGSFKIPITLTSTDVPAPNGCTATTPVNPPHTGGNPPGGNPPGTIDTVVISGVSDGTVPVNVDNGPLSGLGGKGSGSGFVTIPNTGRFFQEIDIVGWLGLMILGGIVAWRRRRRESEEVAYA
ncbi:MAG: hypothetical protein ABI632_00350 [Pseudolysinimonas sp.]